jgi:hypothetical protein
MTASLAISALPAQVVHHRSGVARRAVEDVPRHDDAASPPRRHHRRRHRVPLDVDELGAVRMRVGEHAQPILLRAVEHAAFAQRAAGHDRRSGAPVQGRRRVGTDHPVEAQLDEIGVGLGGDALPADGVRVAPDDGDAEVSHG